MPTIISDTLRDAIHPLSGTAGEYDRLIDSIGTSKFVLLGEATHGTHEFYEARANITKRLIEEKGFTAVAVEADWPDAYRVNEYVRGAGHYADSLQAMAGFQRFPSWMWRNTDVVDFVAWMRGHNDALSASELKAGFYGLDLYSLYTSIAAVLRYLDKVDPEAAQRARKRYSCFEQFGENTQAYGYAAGMGFVESCEGQVVSELTELQRRAAELAQRDGRVAEDEFFFAEQNARLVKNAEEYYRSMFRGRSSSWNLRDRHMAETLDALTQHLEKRYGRAKIVVWEHNSHIGDARATEMGEAGELNVGQLVRERYGREVFLVGFSTFNGTVTAASDWDGPAERKRVRPALAASYEALFHELGVPRFLIGLRDDRNAIHSLDDRRLERAIGVIYRPETERGSHYFYARLPKQFDAVLHFDDTHAVEPLERTSTWETGEPPETYPFGV